MNEPRIKQLVLKSRARYIFALMGRQCGKTELALDWVIHHALHNAYEDVLYIVPTQVQAAALSERLVGKVPNAVEVRNAQTNIVTLANGSKIIFKAINNSIDARLGLAGMSPRKIVIDDAGYVPYSDSIMALATQFVNAQMLLVSSNIGGILKEIRDRRPSSAVYFTYDYRDALQDGIYKPQMVFEFQHAMSEEQFRNEFGPFAPLVQVDNEAFMSKLRSMSELEESV